MADPDRLADIRRNRVAIMQDHNIKEYTDLNSIKEELDKSKKLLVIAGAVVSKEREVPDYIVMDEKNIKAKFVRVPKFSEVPYPTIMEPNLVIEYYSR